MIEVIDFWAGWCGPCHAMHPIVEEAEKAYDGKIKFTKVNVDEGAEMAGKHGIMSIPTYLALKDGVEVERKIGAMTRDSFFKWLDLILTK